MTQSSVLHNTTQYKGLNMNHKDIEELKNIYEILWDLKFKIAGNKVTKSQILDVLHNISCNVGYIINSNEDIIIEPFKN